MRVLIIEDEPQAAARIERLIKELVPSALILDKLDSVKRAVEWFSKNPKPDLALMDIQLADGLSFKIFEHVEIRCPVIFTTAYDEYALKAFKVNSIDYILKPVDRDELNNALVKLTTLTKRDNTDSLQENINQVINLLSKKFKERFIVKVGEHLHTIQVKDIIYFYSHDKTTFCVTLEGRTMIIDFSLEQLETMLDPEIHFRVNRKYLIKLAAIKDIITYTNSRLRLILLASTDNDIIVARERVQEFKQWLDG